MQQPSRFNNKREVREFTKLRILNRDWIRTNERLLETLKPGPRRVQARFRYSAYLKHLYEILNVTEGNPRELIKGLTLSQIKELETTRKAKGWRPRQFT